MSPRPSSLPPHRERPGAWHGAQGRAGHAYGVAPAPGILNPEPAGASTDPPRPICHDGCAVARGCGHWMRGSPTGGVPTVPSYPREPSGSVCWNCDRDARETVAITLRAPSGAARAFALCRACDAAVYPALVRVPTDAGMEVVRGVPGLRTASAEAHAAPSEPTPLRELRAERLLSIRDLARLAGVAPSTVYLIEAGRAAPHPSTIRAIAAALGIDPLQVAELRRAVAARARPR